MMPCLISKSSARFVFLGWKYNNDTLIYKQVTSPLQLSPSFVCGLLWLWPTGVFSFSVSSVKQEKIWQINFCLVDYFPVILVKNTLENFNVYLFEFPSLLHGPIHSRPGALTIRALSRKSPRTKGHLGLSFRQKICNKNEHWDKTALYLTFI